MKDKIIFLSVKNPHKKGDWSGIPFFLYEALSSHYTVEYLALPEFRGLKLLGYYFSKGYSFLFGKKYVFDYGIILALLYGVISSARVKSKSVKFIFSPAGLTEIAFLKTAIPIVSYGDCSTLQLFNYYPALMNVSRISRWEIRYVERKALKRASLSFFSSSWASDFVAAQYGKMCYVIPFGSNITTSSNSRIAKNLSSKVVNLLFIGVDWKRKGGEVALEIHRHLLKKGIRSRLTIVGVEVPWGIEIPECVQVIPNLNKDTRDGEEQLKNLFRQSDFFLLPTIADCTPIVIAEAYAFGVPVLANNTGGLPSMVLNNVTGYLIDENDQTAYTSKIEALLSNPSMYEELSNNCVKYYERIFNWQTAILNLKNIASEVLK